MSDYGDISTLPHGTILNVYLNKGKRGQAKSGLFHVYWVDRECRAAPQVKVRIYSERDVPDELAAYSRFRKEVEEWQETS